MFWGDSSYFRFSFFSNIDYFIIYELLGSLEVDSWVLSDYFQNSTQISLEIFYDKLYIFKNSYIL